MKRLFALLLSLALLLSCVHALALNYTGNYDNEAFFGTMTEVRQVAPAIMQDYTTRYTYGPHPALEGFAMNDTTYVYRSPNYYGYTAASRINTNIAVFVDKEFEGKDEAYAYLEELGLIEKINQIIGSIILVTPVATEDSSGNRSVGFSSADQKYYYALQTALFSNNVGFTDAEGNSYTAVDNVFYGGYGYYYVIGIDGGATFLNNYVVGTVDYCSRIAGLMLVGGSIDRIREPSWFLPVYIVNGEPDVIAKYEKVNGVDALRKEGAKVTRYNKVYPLRQVSVVTCDDLAAAIDDCYWNMFLTAQRGQEVTGGLYSASTPYQGYGSDCAPYSLSKRNPVIDGKTREGICFFPIVSEAYSDIKTAAGEYLQTWYEYLPEEAINGKAPDHTIPMILALHGGGDDPRQFVEGQGFLELAGRERIAIVAPEKANLHTNVDDGREYLSTVLPMLVRDTLAKYPAIDPSRVYVTGYSMGSIATGRAMFGAPELFAAAYPQCAGYTLLEGEEEHFKINGGIEIPMVLTTAEYNFGFYTNVGARLISQANIVCELNGMDPIPEPDFEKYPIGGFDADLYTAIEINDDYVCHTFIKANAKGIPMVGVMYMEGMVHCLYPQYSEIIWDFCKHYSRNQETLEIEYNPYVR